MRQISNGVNKKISLLILGGGLLLPLSAMALGQIGSGGPMPGGSIANIIRNIQMAAGLIFGAIAVICFVMAGALFLIAQGDPEKLKTARSAFIWGVVGVVVGILAFSIIAIVTSFLTSGPKTEPETGPKTQSPGPGLVQADMPRAEVFAGRAGHISG